MTSTLTPKQQAKIRRKINGMTLAWGLGSLQSACSVAAINVALTGKLTDNIPDCMSDHIGHFIIATQDLLTTEQRNSARWKNLIVHAAGTGKDHELQRLEIIRKWVFNKVVHYINQRKPALAGMPYSPEVIKFFKRSTFLNSVAFDIQQLDGPADYHLGRRLQQTGHLMQDTLGDTHVARRLVEDAWSYPPQRVTLSSSCELLIKLIRVYEQRSASQQQQQSK